MSGEGVAAIIIASGGVAVQLLTYFKVGLVHKEMNGMKEALVKSEKSISHAEGKIEGAAEQKQADRQSAGS